MADRQCVFPALSALYTSKNALRPTSENSSMVGRLGRRDANRIGDVSLSKVGELSNSIVGEVAWCLEVENGEDA